MTDVMSQLQPSGDAPDVFRPLSIPFSPEVVSLVQTCQWHPSQWEGWTSHGKAIYVRFRHGQLWIGLAPDYCHTSPTMLFVAATPPTKVTMATSVTRPSTA